MTLAVMLSEKTDVPVAFAPVRRKDGVIRTPGMLVGRPDLSDEAVLTAIAERLTFEGRDPAHAPGVLKAAIANKPLALALLRKLVLPPPQSALVMPTQAILREPKRAQRASWAKRASFGR